MSLDNRKKTGLGEKIDSYEFDFDPAAWEDMEALLDSQEPSDERRILPIFFIFKMLAVMMFLMILAFFVFNEKEAVTSIPKISTTKSPVPKNRAVEILDKLDDTVETKLANIPTDKLSQREGMKIRKLVKEAKTRDLFAFLPRFSEKLFLQNDASPYLPVLVWENADTNFIPKLGEKLAAFNESFAREKVYLQFDKTYFKPGESIWFNAFVRDANTLAASTKSDFLYVEFLKPNGGVLQKIKIKTLNGVGAGDFQIPQTANGGIYKIKAYTNWQRNENVFFEREITVQKNVLPNLRMKLDFMKKSYGAGDEVIANLDLKTLANEFLKSHDFTAKVSIDGIGFKTVKGKTNELGQSKVKFNLPEKLESNRGMLNVMISYNGQTESIARSIPILLKKIDLQFFPEGGELISDFSTKVALKAIDEIGKPADIEGVVLDENSKVVSNFKSFHDGMGSFDIFAKAAKNYTAKITKPKGIEQIYNLPKAKIRGFAIRLVSADNKNPTFECFTTENETMTAVVRINGKVVQSKSLLPPTSEVKINTSDLPVGIAQITLFDSYNVPRAERLFFVNKDKNLNVKIKTDKEKYLPREKISLSVEVTDDRGLGVAGQFSLAVADDKLLSYADDKQGHILSALLLESELKGEIHEPNFYFEKNEKEPAKSRAIALDNLLLTQGWRRFHWHTILIEPKFADIEFRGEKSTGGGNGIVLNSTRNSNGGTSLAGKITETETGEVIIGGAVILNKEGLTISGTVTDIEGFYNFPNIEPGTYEVEVAYTGFKTKIVTDVIAKSGRDTKVEIAMDGQEVTLQEVVVTAYGVPLVKADQTSSGATLKSEQLKKLPTRNIAEIASNVAGVASGDEGDDLNIKGSRSASNFMMVDGIRIQGGLIPKEEIEVELPLGGTPAEFADRADVKSDEIVKVKKAKKRNKPNPRFFGGPPVPKPKPTIYTPRQFYTPKYEAKETPSVREDFRETIYWNSSILTDINGRATVEFYASDAITTFQATMEGIGMQGNIGRGTNTFFTQLPFGMGVKMPANLIEGDVVNVPLSFSNHTNENVNGKLTIAYPEAFEPMEEIPSSIEMKAGAQRTVFVPFRVKESGAEKSYLQVQFKANGLMDEFVQKVKTSPRGFPVSEVFSGNEMEKNFEFQLVNPVVGSVRAEFTAHASPVSDLISGLDRMLRQPSGCFEQTSSSNYPNLLAISYLRESGESQPKVEKRGIDFLKTGYERLKTFEIEGGGFDWFGNAPAHEGLTAYGLMQFEDMKAVVDVEQNLIDRTANWLLSRRNGKGGWTKKQNGAHRWLMSDEISDAYIVWALTEAGFGSEIQPEIKKSLKDAMSCDDTYTQALMANAMLNTDDNRSKDLIAQLLKAQSEDGSWTGETTSIVGSRGKNLTIETTGLVALALMKSGEKSVALEKAIKYLAAAKTQYGFGSTQATVLAMKALVKYAIFSKRMSEDGMIALYLNGDKIAEEKYGAGQSEPVIFDGIENYIRTGKQNLEVKFSETKTALPFEFSLKYSTLQPLNATDCRVSLTTDLRKTKAAQGENIRMDIAVKNITSEGLPNAIAIVGIPAGMSTLPKQLKKLTEESVFDFYEILPTGHIAFYFRGMAPNEVKNIPLELKADLKGDFEAPASVAYLYYENDKQFWSKPERVEVD